MSFRVTTIEDLELLYSVLREEYPDNQIDITFNWNTKEYNLKVSDKKYTNDPEVPLDLNIQVVYGDSVTGDTPILLRDPLSKQIYIKSIESIIELDAGWQKYPEFKMFDTSVRIEKQYGTTPYQVWSDKGWTSIKKVIRHKTDKKIYRVLTNSSCVDVTEDHSLCTSDFQKIKPMELGIGQSLLHSFPKPPMQTNSLDSTLAKCLGFFMNNGYISNTTTETIWQLTHSCPETLDYYRHLFEQAEQIQFTITRSKTTTTHQLNANSNVYYIMKPKNESDTRVLIDRYYPQFYHSVSSANKNLITKIVPHSVINSDQATQNNFAIGFLSASEYPIHPVYGKLAAQGLYYVFKNIGLDSKLHLFTEYSDKYYIDINNWSESNYTEITDLYDLGTISPNKFVYDIETECGRFNAGIGQLIVYNTDSVFLQFKYNRKDFDNNRQDTFRLATLCGEKLTNEIFRRPPIEMEFEKVFQPFILLTKKRYIAQKYENTKDPFQLKGLDAKGIALTRRDYCQMVKRCYKEIIDTIMDTKGNTVDPVENIRKSIAVFKSYIDKITRYDIQIDDLVVSAMLAKSYKTKPVHVLLAEKLKARKEEVQVGDRIPYIFIESDDPKRAKSELGEDPQYAIKHGLKFNRKCYLEQLAKPILGFYKIVLKDYPQLLDETIDYVNDNLESYGGKRLKPSDFKIEE